MSSLASEIGELVHSPMGQAGGSGGIEWLGGGASSASAASPVEMLTLSLLAILISL